MDTNSSQVKLFDPVRRDCILKFGQAGTRPGALLYPYRIAILPGHNLVGVPSDSERRVRCLILVGHGSTFSATDDPDL